MAMKKKDAPASLAPARKYQKPSVQAGMKQRAMKTMIFRVNIAGSS
jgi:hypothetical protein